jgi:hypothetical protein
VIRSPGVFMEAEVGALLDRLDRGVVPTLTKWP